MNLSFILGSAAVCERLWSIAKMVMSDRRKELSPVVFEAILFLNQNQHLRDTNDVQAALVRNRSNRTQERIAEAEEHEMLAGVDTNDINPPAAKKGEDSDSDDDSEDNSDGDSNSDDDDGTSQGSDSRNWDEFSNDVDGQIVVRKNDWTC